MVARHEVLNIQAWNAEVSAAIALTPYVSVDVSARADLSIDTLSIVISDKHPAMQLLRTHRNTPVIVSFEVNGVELSGLVTALKQTKDGEVTITVSSDSKHAARLLARARSTSAIDGATAQVEAPVGDLAAQMIGEAAQRTGLPVYILQEHEGDVVQVEIGSEDTVADVLAPALEASDTFIDMRMLFPGDELPGTGDILRVQGRTEFQWEQDRLAAGAWPQAKPHARLKRAAIMPPTTPMPHLSWAGWAEMNETGGSTAKTRGVCWMPFDIGQNDRGYWQEDNTHGVRVATVEQLAEARKAGWFEHVTRWAAGTFGNSNDTALRQAIAAGLVVKTDGSKISSVSAALNYIGNSSGYAWFDGTYWVLANAAAYQAEDAARNPNIPQLQTPGVLVHIHAGRDRRNEVLFSATDGGGLEDWQTTTTSPEAAMVHATTQLSQSTLEALQAGTAAVDPVAGTLTPGQASQYVGELPDTVTAIDVNASPFSTVSGTDISRHHLGGAVNINAAGAFFYREMTTTTSSGTVNPLAEIGRAYAEAQGSTSIELTPGFTQTSVFGDDVVIDGRVIPGWKPGDRVSFTEGVTRISEVVAGFELHAAWDAPLRVTPVLSRADNGVLDTLVERLRRAERDAANALQQNPRRVPKDDVDTVVDDNKTVKDARQVAETANSAAGFAQRSADGKSTIFYGATAPTGAKAGDTWFKDVAGGGTVLMQFVNGKWVEKVNTQAIDAELAANQAALTELNEVALPGLRQELEALDTEVAREAAEKLATLETKLANADRTLKQELQGELAALDDALSGDLATSLTELRDELEALDALTAGEVADKLATLETKLANADKALKIGLQGELAALDAALSGELTSSLASLKEELETLDTAVAREAADNLAALETKLENADKALKQGLQGELNALDTALSGELTTSLARLKEELEAADTAAAQAVADTLTQLESRLQAADEAVKSDLADDLAAARKALEDADDAVSTALSNQLEEARKRLKDASDAIAEDLAEVDSVVSRQRPGNLFPDPFFADSSWPGGAHSVTNGVFELVASGVQTGRYYQPAGQYNSSIQFERGASYLMTADVRFGSTSGIDYVSVYARVPRLDGTGIWTPLLGRLNRVTVGPNKNSYAWAPTSAILTFPDDIATGTGTIGFFVESSHPDGDAWITNVRLVRAADNSLIIDGAVTAAKVQAGVIEADHIASGAVEAEKLAADSVVAGKIAADAILARNIRAEQVTTTKLAADAVTANKLAADSVLARNIRAGEVTTKKLAADAVTAEKIAADAVTANQLQAENATIDKLWANGIAAKSVTTNRVLVASNGNMLPEISSYVGLSSRDYPNPDPYEHFGKNQGDPSIWLKGTVNVYIRQPIKVVAGQKYRLRYQARASVNMTSHYLVLRAGDLNGPENPSRAIRTRLNGSIHSSLYLMADGKIGGGWKSFDIIFEPPVTEVAYLFLYANHPDGTANPNYQWFKDVRLEKMTGATLIEDGAITTGKVAADAITANELATDSVTTNAIKAGEVAAKHLAADAVTANKLLAEEATIDKLWANGIASKSLLTNRILVANNGNMLPDLSTYTTADEKPEIDPYPSPFGVNPGAQSLWIAGSSSVNVNHPLNLVAGQKYRFSYRINATVDGTTHYWQLMESTVEGRIGQGVPVQIDGINSTYLIGNEVANRAVREYVVEFEIATTSTCCLRLFPNHTRGADNTGGYQWIRDLRLEKMTGATLIEDGAITTNKIAANAVTADAIKADAVTSNKIKAGEVAAKHLAADAVTANKLLAEEATIDKLWTNGIAAKSITASRLTVSPGNIFPDPHFQDPSWGGGDATRISDGILLTADGKQNGVYLQPQGQLDASMQHIPGVKYLLTAHIRFGGNANITKMSIYARSKLESGSTGTYKVGEFVRFPTDGQPHASYRYMDNSTILDFGSRSLAAGGYFTLGFYVESSASAGNVEIRNIRLTPMSGTTLIEDGAITTGKVAADAITSNEIKADQILAKHVKSDQILAKHVKSGEIKAEHLLAEDATINKLWTNGIAAKSIVSNRILVAGNGNMLPEIANYAGTSTRPEIDPYPRPFGINSAHPSVWAQGRANCIIEHPINLVAGQKYRFSYRVNASVNGTRHYWQFLNGNAEGRSGGDVQVKVRDTTSSYVINNEIANTSIRSYDVEFEAITTGTYYLQLYPNHQNGTTNETGYQWFRDLRLEKMTGATLIEDGAVTTDKIAANAVTANSIKSGEITSDHISSSKISSDKITVKNGFIKNAMIDNGEITNAKIANLDAGKITTGTINANRIGARTITSDHISSSKISSDKISVKNGFIKNAMIGDGQVNNAKIANLNASKITAGTINANRIGAKTIEGKHLAVDTIEANQIKANAFTQAATNLLPITPGTETPAWAGNADDTNTQNNIGGVNRRWYRFNGTRSASSLNKVAVDPNIEYDFEAWLHGTTDSVLYVNCLNQNGNGAVESGTVTAYNRNSGNSYLIQNMKLISGWRKVSSTIKFTPETRFIYVNRIYGNHSNGVTGSAYIADMTLTPHIVPQAEINAMRKKQADDNTKRIEDNKKRIGEIEALSTELDRRSVGMVPVRSDARARSTTHKVGVMMPSANRNLNLYLSPSFVGTISVQVFYEYSLLSNKDGRVYHYFYDHTQLTLKNASSLNSYFSVLAEGGQLRHRNITVPEGNVASAMVLVDHLEWDR